jgi:hypothetical protein
MGLESAGVDRRQTNPFQIDHPHAPGSTRRIMERDRASVSRVRGLAQCRL